MRKFLILGLNFYPEPTGIGKYTGDLAIFLSDKGYKVRVITTPPYYPHWQIQTGYKAWQYRRESWQGIEIVRCPLWVPHQLSGFMRLAHLASFAFSSVPALVSQLTWRPDMVLCIAPSILNAPFALAFAYLSSAKAWLHIQDFELDAALNLGLFPGGMSLARLAFWVERILLNSFDHLSTISDRMLVRLNEKDSSQDRNSLFPNWVDTSQIFPLEEDNSNQLRVNLNLSPEQIVVLYAGTMGKKQGLEHLLSAADRLQDYPDIQFILCGDGVVRSEIEIAAGRMPNLRFLPVQPPDQLNNLLNLADIHVLPQRSDAADLVMPSKLTGMLASGKPVIATAYPDTELGQVVSKVGIIVPPEDDSALAAAILALRDDPVRREHLGYKGRKYACLYFEKKVILTDFVSTVEALFESENHDV